MNTHRLIDKLLISFYYMITNESQVRLSIELQGRLGATASNSTSKKRREKYLKAIKKGIKASNGKYKAPKYQTCYQILNLSSESVNFFISEEARPVRISPSNWKKASKIERLETHLQITADYISGHSDTKFTYKIIN